MASITIRRLDDAVKARLRMRAARDGRLMEEEEREILKACVAGGTANKRNLAESIGSCVEPFGGVELVLPKREPIRRPPPLSE